MEQFPTLTLTRTFHAPVERVFQAWSSPELIEEWFGPAGYKSNYAELDFHIGGKYLISLKSGSGKMSWVTGNFTEIIWNEKIVCTAKMSDKRGNALYPSDAGMMSDLPENFFLTVEFDEFNHDQTLLTLSHEGIPKKMHDECEDLWNSTLSKLQSLVEQYQYSDELFLWPTP